MIAFPLFEPTRTDDGWRVEADVPQDTDYVRGHFPGAPIVPAVAQFALLSQAASACWRQAVEIAGVVDVRFKGQVEPGQRLEVSITPHEPAEELRFRLTTGGKPVSQGVLRTRTEPNG